MQLLRSLWFFTAHYDIDLACTHIAGVANTTADHLSRNLFFSQNPHASLLPTPLPASLLQITSIPGPDWTSAHFSQLFISTIKQHPHTSSTMQAYTDILPSAKVLLTSPCRHLNSPYCYLLHILPKATYRTALSGFTCLQFATFTSLPAFSTHLVLSQLLA